MVRNLFYWEDDAMTRQEALSVLMLSPIYFMLSLSARKLLLDEFVKNYG